MHFVALLNFASFSQSNEANLYVQIGTKTEFEYWQRWYASVDSATESVVETCLDKVALN